MRVGSPNRTRIVLDTNLLVSGLVVPHGLPHRLLTEWRRGSVRLLITDAILDEYAAVLARPQFAAKYGLTAAAVAALLRRMRAVGERVVPTEAVPVAVRDLKDTHLLTAALGDDAKQLLTTAQHLATFGELALTPETEMLLAQISASTVARMLAGLPRVVARLPRRAPGQMNRLLRAVPMGRIAGKPPRRDRSRSIWCITAGNVRRESTSTPCN